MDHKMRKSRQLAEEMVTDEVLETIGVPFEYPEEGVGKNLKIDIAELEPRMVEFLRNFISMEDWDFLIFKQRVLLQRNVREIGKFPLFRGRMWVTSRCKHLAKRFPMFKSALLRGFTEQEKKEDYAEGTEERKDD